MKHQLLNLFVLMALTCATFAESTDHPPSTTPLTRAIRLEKFEEAKKHIQPKWVNQPDGGNYHPLTYAAYTANNDLTEALLKAGADPDVIEANGKTALYVTANMANLKGLELLHQYKAKKPSMDALSPAVAAVHSSSLECLKKLLKLYPDIDLNRGWENRKDGWKLVDSPGDPIAYAAYHGYNDMALYLLAKKVSPSGIDYRGKGALHHAAINPQCSRELVKSLVEAGCSPVSQSIWNGTQDYFLSQVPRTPIDYAVLSGDFEKIKLMASSIDASKNRAFIRYSAQLAAAYRRDKAAQYLLSLIGEDLSTYRKFMGQEKVAIDERSNLMTSISGDELSKIMPRSKSRPGKKPPLGSVAIISDPRLRNGSALLELELSKQGEIQLVERNQLDAIAAEQGLRGLNDGDSQLLHKSLDLIPAKYVVVMSLHKVAQKSFVRTVVIDSASGLILATHAFAEKVVTSKSGAENMAAAVMLSISGDTEARTGISITMIAPESLSHAADSATRDINTILPHLVGNTEGVASLSRNQLQYLQREKAIGIEGAFWAAAWVVDGGMGAIKDGEAKLTLRAIHVIGKHEVKASRLVKVDQVDDGLRECWNKLIKGMGIGSGRDKVVAVDKDALEVEAQVLQRYAQWLYDGGYYPEAAQLIDACLELGQRTRDRIKLALTVQLKLSHKLVKKEFFISDRYWTNRSIGDPGLVNYGQWGEYGNPYHNQPRSSSPRLRTKLLDSVDQIIHLGELAEESMHVNPRHERAYGWTADSEYDRDMVETLYPFVSSALSELIFYASTLDHTMILADPVEQSKLQVIVDQIERITTLYVAHIEKLKKDPRRAKASVLKFNTVQYLLSRDFNYYSRYSPELFDRMMEIMVEQVKDHKFDLRSLPPLLDLAGSQSVGTREVGLNAASKAWGRLTRVCMDKARKQQLSLANTSPLYHQTERDGRVRWLKVLCAQPFTFPDRFRELSNIGNHPIGNLVGMDERKRGQVPSHVVESSLLEQLDELKGTAEYLRLAALYREIEGLKAKNSNIVSFLKARPELKKGSKSRDENVKWSQDAWRKVHAFLATSNQLNPEVEDLFSKLAGEIGREGLVDAKIRLEDAEIMMLPKQPGHTHRLFHSVYERSVISRDELWLPGFYAKERKAYMRTMREEDLDADNAIQVVSLKDRSARTIILPRVAMETKIGSYLYPKRDRASYGRVCVTGDYAYFTPIGRHLYCIRRSDHRVSEVKMPEGFKQLTIRLIATHKQKELLLVIAKEWSWEQNSLHQVLFIEGDKVIKTLTSNRRKPSESPMDRPNIQPGHIEFKGNTVLIGDDNYKGHVYDLDSGKWKSLKKSQVYGKSANYYDTAYDYFEELPKQLYSHFLDSPKGMKYGLWHFRANWPATLRLPPSDIFVKHAVDQINVSVPEVDHPAFNNKWFPMSSLSGEHGVKPLSIRPDDQYRAHYKGWWVSPNEAVKHGLYKVVLIGKWENQYLMGLKLANMDKANNPIGHFAEEYGVEAFWYVSKSTFEDAQKPLTNRHSRLIDFRSAWQDKHFEDVATLNYDGPKNSLKWYKQRYLEMPGDGAALSISPVLQVKDMQLVISLTRKNRNQLLDFIFEVGDEQNATEIFNSKQHEIGTAPSYPGPAILYIPLPDRVKRIRLINNSPKNNSIRINKFLFMRKK